MARAHTNQANFVAGEVSPLINPRVDIEKYLSSLKKCENFIVFPQGTCFRRSGTGFINSVKDSSAFTRLIPFEFSTIQAYSLEFGNEYMRVFRDEGTVVETSQNITAITQANPAVVTINAHGYSNGDFVILTEIVGMEELNGRSFEVANVTANTFELLGIDSTTYEAYASGGKASKIFEITTPYQTAQLQELDYAQSADFLYLAQGNNIPQTLTRTGDTSWTLSDFTPLDGPYFKENTDASITLTPSGTTGTITVTASSAIFAATDTSGVGGTGSSNRSIRFRDKTGGETVGWGFITGFTSTTQVEVTLEVDLANTTPTDFWRLGAWSSTSGYPKHVGFYEERLIWANTEAQPDTLWMSKSGDFQVYSPTELDSSVQDDNGIAYTLASGQVNAINWLDSGQVLLIGTTGSEWQINSDSLDNPLTPSNISARRQTTEGSKENIKAIRVNNSTFFIQRAGRTLQEYVFDANANAFAGEKASILSEHIFREGDNSATYIEYQKEPNSVVWSIRSDGQLVGLTYNRRQNVYSWHRQLIGGSFDTTEHAVVESIAVIPSSAGTEDTAYMIIKRTINGQTERYVEYLKKDFYPISPTDKDDMFFVDSGLTLDLGEPITSGDLTEGKLYRVVENDGLDLTAVGGSATPKIGDVFTATTTATPVYGNGSVEEVKKTIVGLDHLEGEEITPVGDGAVFPNVTVSNGQVTLQSEVNRLHIGYSYTSLIETLPIEAGGNFGTARGQVQRVSHVVVNLFNSIGLSHGPEKDDLTLESFRELNHNMNQSPNFFTGPKRIQMKAAYGRDETYVIAQTQPYPLNILSLQPELVTY